MLQAKDLISLKEGSFYFQQNAYWSQNVWYPFLNVFINGQYYLHKLNPGMKENINLFSQKNIINRLFVAGL